MLSWFGLGVELDQLLDVSTGASDRQPAAVSQGLAQTRIRDALLCAVDVHEAREANEKREAEGLDVAEQRLSELMRGGWVAVNREKNMRLGSSARRNWI